MGVGIGEASASPAAYSMLSDYYPPRLRATVIAIAQSGVYIGSGVGLFLGGFLLDAWEAAYPVTEQAPLGLKGWQVAFMAVGIPGLLLAIWVRTLREPVRGSSEGLEVPEHPAPFSVLGTELRAMMPGINLIDLKRDGGSVAANALHALLIAATAWALTLLTGNPAQWIALGIGVYVVVTWVQSLAVRDPVTYNMTLKSKAFVYLLIAVPVKGVVIYAMGFWVRSPLVADRGHQSHRCRHVHRLEYGDWRFCRRHLGWVCRGLSQTQTPLWPVDYGLSGYCWRCALWFADNLFGGLTQRRRV